MADKVNIDHSLIGPGGVFSIKRSTTTIGPCGAVTIP
ncbi:hypothetical protein ACWDHW_02875 [Streptomyces melanosporofaciens]